MKTLSLFTGCGGLDLGFEAAGFNILAAADIMPESCITLRENMPKIPVFGPPTHSGDVADVNVKLLEKELTSSLDVIIGGPPCQPFSVAAAQRFLKGDTRFKRLGFNSDKGSLIFQYLRIIVEFRPKVFVIENVPGFVTIDNGETIKNLQKALEAYGYKIHGPYVIQMAEYGVPQLRKRAIIVGSLFNHDFELPPARFTQNSTLFSNSFRTVAQALVDIPNSAKNHITRAHKDESINRYRKLKFGEREPLGRVDRLNPLLPSKTVIAGGSTGGGRSHLHPYIARTITVREAARLQTFPDDYVFSGSMGRQFTQVGNAVPPLLAEQLARQIGKIFFNKKYDKPLIYERSYLPADIANSKLKEESLRLNPEQCYFDIQDKSIRKEKFDTPKNRNVGFTT